MLNLAILNQKQHDAVVAPLGPVLVLAGAGSGKTRVLTYRIAHIIEQGWFAPEHILAVTFTNKAAGEMKTRLAELLSSRGGLPTVGTFHSLGVRILRRDITRLGYTSQFQIFDSDDVLKLLRDVLAELDVPKQFTPQLFRSYISSAKNLLQTPSELRLGLEPAMHDLVQRVYIRYQDLLHRQNSVDFDDLLLLPIRLFQIAPEVLAKYQAMFQYVLVDEYQDTNQAQYTMLRLLSVHRNLFVVGDDAQSIYGFRGSNIANILNFEQDFPDAVVVKLEQNYRSTKNILAAAQEVINLNSEQKPKTLWTDNAAGHKVVVEEVFDGRAEARFVAEQIIKLSRVGADEIDYEYEPEEDRPVSILDRFLQKRPGLVRGPAVPRLPKDHASLEQFAVLYRTHAQSRQLEEVFLEAGIPYHIVGGLKFYERKEIKDVIAYLRLLNNVRDVVSLKRVVNEPPRGVGDKSFAALKDAFYNWADTVQDWDAVLQELTMVPLPPKARTGVTQFIQIMLDVNRLAETATLSDVLRQVLKLSGYQDYLKDGTEAGDVRVENVKELFNVTATFDAQPWREGLNQFLEEVALVSDLDGLDESRDVVTLMTLHSAKGLEFDTVFFVGLEEGLLPHGQSLLDPKSLAEEVRLAYVGLTRARQRLFLTYAQARMLYGSTQMNAPSRILKALPESAISRRVTRPAFDDSDAFSYETIID
jgi:DNA helicase-2/ATP-dependent DNA helicase PcrA